MTTDIAKKAALSILRSMGVFSLAANSSRRSRRLLILCYHGISLRDEHLWRPRLYISPGQFRQRLEVLKSFSATVLPFGEAIHRLHANSLPPRSVAITFDDGFYNLFQHAFPALDQFGYPSTLYLATEYCCLRAPVFDLIVSYLLWKSSLPVVDLADFGLVAPRPIRTDAECLEVLQAILAWVEANHLDTLSKDQVARHLAERLTVDYDDLLKSRLLQLMTPEEVGQASRAGVDIQLHTHRHQTPGEHFGARQD